MAVDRNTVLRALLRRRGILIGYIGSIVRDWDLAEDVFQEVSLLAIEKCASIENEAALPTWLRTAARLTALNFLRKHKHNLETLDGATLDLLDTQWMEADESQYGEPEIQALRRCLGKLAPESKRLIRLRYDEGLSGKELAERTGKPLNTIYVGITRIHRFLERCVRAQLAAQEEGSNAR